jgi:hypothetical protein
MLLLVVFELEREAEGLVGELDALPRDELVVVVVLGQHRSPHILLILSSTQGCAQGKD